MLDRDGDAQADGAGALLGIGEDGVLQHECTRRQVGIGGEHALVDVEHGAGGAVAHTMCPDSPATPHRHIRDRYHLVEIPVEMTGVGRTGGEWLIERGAFHPAIHHELEAPESQPIVAEAAAYAHAFDQRDAVGQGAARRDHHHRPAAHAQLAAFPGGLIQQQLVALYQWVAHGSQAQCGEHLPGLPQASHLFLERRGRDPAGHDVDGAALQSAA